MWWVNIKISLLTVLILLSVFVLLIYLLEKFFVPKKFSDKTPKENQKIKLIIKDHGHPMERINCWKCGNKNFNYLGKAIFEEACFFKLICCRCDNPITATETHYWL